MSVDFSTLVTDRTAADVKHWEQLHEKGFANMTDAEKAEWLSGTMKGAYNTSDLNRVGTALNYLYERLLSLGYINYSDIFTVKTNWAVTSIPTTSDIEQYLHCISVIREALASFDDTPPAPTNIRRLTHEEANNIEKILISVETAINNMIAVFRFCGMPYCGDLQGIKGVNL